MFAKTCQQCHTLYGVGAKIGPDLTGSNRADLDYLLSNVVDPSAVIAKEYQPTVIITIDGRVITGIVTAEDDKSVTIRTATETLVLPKDEIDERDAERHVDDARRSAQAVHDARDAVAGRLPARQGAGADAGHEGQRRPTSSTATT